MKMDEVALQEYEMMLLELQSSLRTELDGTSDESAPVAVDGRMGRISRGDALQVQQMALAMRRRREERLSRISSALDRIQKGLYGPCARCRNPISTARLDAFPDAVLCVRCASQPRRI